MKGRDDNEKQELETETAPDKRQRTDKTEHSPPSHHDQDWSHNPLFLWNSLGRLLAQRDEGYPKNLSIIQGYQE